MLAESQVHRRHLVGRFAVVGVRTESLARTSKEYGDNVLFYDSRFDYGLVFTYGLGRFGPNVAAQLFNSERSGPYRKLDTVRAPYTLGY